MAAELKSQNNNPVFRSDGIDVEISNGCGMVKKNNNTASAMNEDILESTTDPHDSKSHLESSLDYSINVSKENSGKSCENSSNTSNVLFETAYNRPVTVKDFIRERNVYANHANQENFSDVLDTVQIIRKDQTTGDKKFSCFCISLQRRTLLAIVLVITIILIITASGIGGYYLNIYERVKTTKDTLDETTRSTSEATSTNTFATEDTLDETTRSTSEATTTNTITTESTTNAISEPDTYKFITRSEYKALSPNATLVPLSTPVKRVIIAHTAGEDASCSDIDSCSKKVLDIQIYHMVTNKYDDIGLNFLVGGDGNVYEGRGYYRGAHTCGYNEGSICISLIGNFEKYEATERQLEAAKSFIVNLKRENKIDSNYQLFGQTQLNGYSSPGKYVYSLIQSWEQWTSGDMERFICNN